MSPGYKDENDASHHEDAAEPFTDGRTLLEDEMRGDEGEDELDLADGSRIHIECAVTVDSDKGEILVDYTGSSGASPYGINVVRNYTHAYTTFAVRS